MSRRHTFDSLLLVSIRKGRKKEKKEKQITNCDYGDTRVSKSPKWPIMCSRWLGFYISYLTSSVSASCHVCRESPAHRYSAARAFSTPPLPWKGPRSPHGSLSSNWSAHPLAVPKLRPKNHLPCMPRCICLFPKWCWSVWSALCIICICICIFCINAPPERELELERVWHPMKSCSSKSPKKTLVRKLVFWHLKVQVSYSIAKRCKKMQKGFRTRAFQNALEVEDLFAKRDSKQTEPSPGHPGPTARQKPCATYQCGNMFFSLLEGINVKMVRAWLKLMTLKNCCGCSDVDAEETGLRPSRMWTCKYSQVQQFRTKYDTMTYNNILVSPMWVYFPRRHFQNVSRFHHRGCHPKSWTETLRLVSWWWGYVRIAIPTPEIARCLSPPWNATRGPSTKGGPLPND